VILWTLTYLDFSIQQLGLSGLDVPGFIFMVAQEDVVHSCMALPAARNLVPPLHQGTVEIVQIN